MLASGVKTPSFAASAGVGAPYGAVYNQGMAEEIPLTRRELEILTLLAEGLSNDEIAARLSISPNTVKVHLRNIFEKMGVQSRTEATMEAVRKGWIAVPGLEPQAAPEESSADAVAAPAWPPLASSWQPWRVVALAAVLALALVVVFWPSRRPLASPAQPSNFTTDRGEQRTEPAPRQDTPRWTPRAAMPTARSRAAGALIDGRLFVVGGETAAGDTDAVEMYDPNFDTWQVLPPRPIAARDAGAASLDGKLYVAGGCSGDKPVADVHVFDPAAQRWQQGPSLPQPNCGLALIAAGGRLYALGGWDGANVLDSVWVYETGAGSWRPAASLPAARAMASAAWLRDHLYVIGGDDGTGPRAEMWVYDPAAGTWKQGPGLVEPRAGLAVGAEGSSIYAFGGGSGSQPSLHERFDLNTQSWSTIDSPRLGPWHHAVGAIIGPNLHIVGGWAGDYLDDHEAYQASHLLFLPIGAQGAKP